MENVLKQREKEYALGLAQLIKCKTVSSFKQFNKEEFYSFHILLKETFPNLFAKVIIEDFNGSLLIKWEGKSSENPILLMNHHDVVEVKNNWEHDAFSGEISEGKIWGRGTLDTKGGLYCMLQSAEELIKEGFVPQNDVYFVSTCNEETTGEGGKEISTALRNRGIKFSFVLDEGGMIVNEPIGGAKGDFAMVGVGEKSICSVKFIAKSNGGHAATPQKNTPLVRLGKFMAKVEKSKAFKVNLSDTICQMFKVISKKIYSPLRLVLGNAKFFKPILKKVVPNVSLSAGAMVKTTVAFTRAQGSDGDNVIPSEAYVVANVRCCQHQGVSQSLEVLKKIANKYQIETQVLDVGVESPLSSYKTKQFNLIAQTIKKSYKDVEVSPYIMTGASDSRFMSVVSDNCYRFTPFKVTDEQINSVHGADENLTLSNLVPAVDFYKNLIKGI